MAVAGDIDRPAQILVTIRSEIGAPLPMCWLGARGGMLGSGVWITHEHPVWKAQPSDTAGAAADAAGCVFCTVATRRWRPAAALASPVVCAVGAVYNFVLDHGHVLRAGGVDIVTLAHSFCCKELAHPFWGTTACVDVLRESSGWPNVTLNASECRRLQALAESAGEIESAVGVSDFLPHSPQQDCMTMVSDFLQVH